MFLNRLEFPQGIYLAMQSKTQENIYQVLASLDKVSKSESLSVATRRHVEELIELVKKDLNSAEEN